MADRFMDWLLWCVHRCQIRHRKGHVRKWTQPTLSTVGVHMHITDKAVADGMATISAPLAIPLAAQPATHHVRANRKVPPQTARDAQATTVRPANPGMGRCDQSPGEPQAGCGTGKGRRTGSAHSTRYGHAPGVASAPSQDRRRTARPCGPSSSVPSRAEPGSPAMLHVVHIA